MKTALFHVFLTAGLMSTAAFAQDRTATSSATAKPASAWRDMRFDLARLPSGRSSDIGVIGQASSGIDVIGQASSGIDVAVAPRLVASVDASVENPGLTNNRVSVAPVFRQETTVSGRLGIVVGTRGLVYGRLGYSQLDTNDGLAGLPARRLSLSGVLVGAGSEVRLSSNVSLRSEYQVVDYAASTTSNRVVSGLVVRF